MELYSDNAVDLFDQGVNELKQYIVEDVHIPICFVT